MSEIITASNIDVVIKMNEQIADEVSKQALKLQTNTSILRVASMPQLALTILQGFGLVQMPIEDKYWSGAIYVKEGKIIPVLNTAIPRANQYFAAWHEVYHLIFDMVSLDHIIKNDNIIEERKAEYFAACMLLQGVGRYYAELPDMDIVSKVMYCMSAFQAPYKAVLISLYEEAVKSGNDRLKDNIREAIGLKIDDIEDRFISLGLDKSLVMPSYVVNLSYLQERIQKKELANPELRYHDDNDAFLKNIKQEIKMIMENNR
jgi:hypothetical protein